MHDSKWLGGAFSAYGLVDNMGRAKTVSLFTSSEGAATYVKEFHERAQIGRVKPFKGRWHWVCDDPLEIKQFYLAVGPHLVSYKRDMIEAAWDEWRHACSNKGLDDPGDIKGPLFPALQSKLTPAAADLDDEDA